MFGTALATSLSQLYMGVVVKPMTAELDWSRTAVALPITIGTLMSGLIGPFAGRLADRYGPRALTSGGVVVFGLTVLLISRVEHLWQFAIVYVIGRSISVATLQTVTPSTTITNWFRRIRGRVLGLLSTSLGLGGSLTVFLGQLVIDAAGWRTAFLVPAALAFCVLLPLCIVVLRRRPEDMGLRPDGDPVTPASAKAVSRSASTIAVPDDEHNWTTREATRTPALWLIAAAITIGIISTGGTAFMLVPYYTDVGVATTAAALAVSIYSLSGAFASALWGFLSERFSERYLAVFAMLLGAAAVLSLFVVSGAVSALLSAAVFGFASRGETALVNLLVAHYYGRSSYGTINGIIQPFQQGGLGLGPTVSSLLFDLSGGYHTGLIVFSAAYVIAAALFFLARKPTRPTGKTAVISIGRREMG